MQSSSRNIGVLSQSGRGSWGPDGLAGRPFGRPLANNARITENLTRGHSFCVTREAGAKKPQRPLKSIQPEGSPGIAAAKWPKFKFRNPKLRSATPRPGHLRRRRLPVVTRHIPNSGWPGPAGSDGGPSNSPERDLIRQLGRWKVHKLVGAAAARRSLGLGLKAVRA